MTHRKYYEIEPEKAKYDLGYNYYIKGYYKEAIKWWQQAATAGNETARSNLDILYLKKHIVQKLLNK